ncbi:MAG: hypothetical protein ABI859_12370 [Pseudomonadota bacterium]
MANLAAHEIDLVLSDAPITPANSPMLHTKRFLAREVVLHDVPETEDALKLITFDYRKPGLSPQAFQDYWQK